MEVQKAQEATAPTDQALATLEQRLHAAEREKESKKTHMITDIDEMRALKAGNHRSPHIPPRRVDLEKDRLLREHKPASRTSSPSPLGLSRSPLSLPAPTPTSAPASQNKDRIRLDALKVPFIHLLAVRAVSAKFLARKTRASLDDCLALARKYGLENRLDREKFDLKDKAYRELDVWNFPYPSQEDRQEAIENAISAFDRMRISRSDSLWQVLLPKEERGKGKVLSRLDLRTGPVKKSPTPRIHVQATGDTGKENGDTTGNETDRTNANGLTPRTAETNGAAAAKSGTAPAAKKKRLGEKETSTKRTSTKGKNLNTTLTGRVTKKGETKPSPSNIKSAEFVRDSDEEDVDVEMPDATTSTSTTSSTAKQQRQAVQKPKQPSTVNGSKDSSKPSASHPTAPKVAKSDAASNQGQHKAPANSSASQKLSSSQMSKSTSPRKPSPLGSSPLTNVSDSHGHSRSSSRNTATSSSSSSPLMTQVSRPKKADGTAASGVTNSVKPNNVRKSPTETTNPLKRKPESQRPTVTESRTAGHVNGHMEHKRQRTASTSSGSTSGESPSMGRDILRRQLQEKSQRFKRNYGKYKSLYISLSSQASPPRADLEKLQLQHNQLQRMKKEIWDEDRRLREGRLGS